MTIQEATAEGRKRLRGEESAELDVAVLMCWIIKRNRAFCEAHGELKLSGHQEQEYRAFLERRARHEPIAYITGEKEFYGIPFIVDRRVLVPRPETELLVDAALEAISKHQAAVAHDIGTGSGCVAVAIARAVPDVQIQCWDTSRDALKVAKLNLNRYRLNTRVKLRHSEFDPESVAGDVLVANLPYLNREEMSTLAPDIQRFEPREALDGGDDGFDHYRRLFDILAARDDRPRALCMEISPVQSSVVRAEVISRFPGAKLRILKDLASLDRVAVVEWYF